MKVVIMNIIYGEHLQIGNKGQYTPQNHRHISKKALTSRQIKGNYELESGYNDGRATLNHPKTGKRLRNTGANRRCTSGYHPQRPGMAER